MPPDGARRDEGPPRGLQASQPASHAPAVPPARDGERLLVDDRTARRAATRLRVPVIGTLGILLAARHRGDEAVLAPLLADLRAGGFWMTLELEAAVLAEVGEQVLRR